MRLDEATIYRIAELARLDITERECRGYLNELDAILDLVEQMNAVDTSGVEPMPHPRDLALRLRDDRVSEPDRRSDFQAVAPDTEAGLYLVPKVIE